MDESTRERVWQTIAATMQQASGDQPYEESIAEIAILIAYLGQAVEAFSTKQRALQWLSALEEPSAEHLAILEAGAVFVAPILQSVIRVATRSALQQMPAPTGGRPVSRTPQQKQEICEEILRMLGSGLSAAEAKRRVGRKQKLQPKTVDRIWATRGKSPASLVAMHDMQTFLKLLIQ